MRRPMGRLTAGSFVFLFVSSAASAQEQVAAVVAIPAAAAQKSPPPAVSHLTKAPGKALDLRKLPKVAPTKFERPEREEPEASPQMLGAGAPLETPLGRAVPAPMAAAPAPIANFDGLDFASWGAGHPPDTVGDVGPGYYIQAVNTSIGIYQKSGGSPVAAFTFNTFMSQGNFGNLCDTNNFGDPVVLYDTFEDRWVITDFAFQLDGSSNVVNPPGAFQCFAVSKSGDPVSGGWNFYSINTAGGLGDYPKFGVWPDGIYMSANMFGYPNGAPFQGSRVYAFNKAQMYAGAPSAQVVSFDAPSSDFTLLPSNARLQTGTPPAGTPNYYVSTWQFLNALTVYKFHVDWTHISLCTFTGPDAPLAATSWPNSTAPNAPSSGGNNLDVLARRAMMQNQYTNIGGAESLWTAHTVRRQDTTGFAAPRWYQVNVTGGSVAANLPQAATWDPDGANVMYRFMPSLALDRAGNMALGYSTSNSTTKPAIKYAGRLSSDPVNTFSQTEQLLIQGTGTQTGNCGGAPCTRWGDYSAMSLDPDGCTFWYTSEYYAADGLNDLTRIGSFAFPGCTSVGAGGTLQGTVTATAGGAPISGATITFGSRTATTDGSGFYQFTGLPAGNYGAVSAAAAGFTASSVSAVAINDGTTTTDDFSLATAAVSSCPVDTAQLDFQAGVLTNLDATTSPGDVSLSKPELVDQSNSAGTTTGTGFGATAWTGQTFIAALSGQLTKADIQLFCSGCGATPPNLTLSVRSTSGGLPTGADLASTTIPGSTFASGSSVIYTATFGSPATLASGTQFALVLRPVSAPAGSGYFWIRSSPSTYTSGSRVLSADSGATWSADTTRDYNFKTYVNAGYSSSGTLVSSLKDANPAPGFVPRWTTLSWTASTPANTSVRFQVAASNSATGPFAFVGPDGTASTYFTTSGASLSQFDGNRYLKYEAFLATTNSTATPVLNDVTVCFCDAPAAPTISAGGPTAICSGGSVTLNSDAPSGNQWYLNGSLIGGATGTSYPATAAGSYTATATASGCESAPSNAIVVTVTVPPPTPTISADTNGTGTQDQACPEVPLTLHANGATGATSYQWYKDIDALPGETNSTYQATGAATYYVVAFNGTCATPQSAGYVVQNPTPHSPFVSFRGQSSSATTYGLCPGASQIIDSDSATGIHWWKDGVDLGPGSQSLTVTQPGVYTAQLDALGCHSQFGRNVTVVRLGDLNLDGVVDAADLVILEAYRLGNATPGVAPFLGTAVAADFDRSGTVDDADITALGHYLTALTCTP